MAVEVRRDSGRAFFQSLERALKADEFLSDKMSVRLLLEKAEREHQANSRKRFDLEGTFRHRVVYSKMDDFIADWCRRRDVKADPYKVFRYEGPERGPTQHETAAGPSRPYIERSFDRLTESAAEIPDARKAVWRSPTSAVAPAFRLQQPLPFGACGEVRYGSNFDDFAKAIYLAAMITATRGDVSRGWTYDCGGLIFFGREPLRRVVGDAIMDAWPDLQERVWKAARVWVIAL